MMNSLQQQITDALTDALGCGPGMWAPGVTPLGWSFKVHTDGALIINRLLGDEYKLRLRKHLPTVFEKAGLAVDMRVE